jgi:hypothetical protein
MLALLGLALLLGVVGAGGLWAARQADPETPGTGAIPMAVQRTQEGPGYALSEEDRWEIWDHDLHYMRRYLQEDVDTGSLRDDPDDHESDWT